MGPCETHCQAPLCGGVGWGMGVEAQLLSSLLVLPQLSKDSSEKGPEEPAPDTSWAC